MLRKELICIHRKLACCASSTRFSNMKYFQKWQAWICSLNVMRGRNQTKRNYLQMQQLDSKIFSSSPESPKMLSPKKYHFSTAMIKNDRCCPIITVYFIIILQYKTHEAIFNSWIVLVLGMEQFHILVVFLYLSILRASKKNLLLGL